MRHSLAAASVVVILGCGDSAGAQPQEPNFAQAPFATGLGAVTDLAWATDASNTLFVTVKGGALRVVRDGVLQSANLATVSPVFTNSECGLLGVAAHPSYAVNGFVYVFVTETVTTQRIYRYTVTENAGTLVGGTKTQIGPDLPTRGVNHDGGSIVIGPDTNIYFGVGNLANGNNVGGSGTASEFTSLGSKIGRMDLNGNAVPTNPYYNAGDGITATDYIFSRGWRNPYGLAFQPGTGALWVLEVGDSREHIFVATPDSNRGWYENGDANPALVPRFAYQRDNGTAWAAGGGCITRGTFYSAPHFPAGYQGNLFFAEYNGNKIIRVRINGTNLITAGDVSLFVTGVNGAIDVEVGPDGALYYAGNADGTVYRLEYGEPTPQNIIVSPNGLTLAEGSSDTLLVRLAIQPVANVQVGVAVNGDSDITASPSSLTFTTANWDTAQAVTISAALDADTTSDSATVILSSGGLTSQNVVVTATDTTGGPTAPTASISAPVTGAMVSGAGAEFFGGGVDDEAPVYAEFYVDGVLEYTDAAAPTGTLGHYHFGGGHLMWDTTVYADGEHTLTLVVYDAGNRTGSHQITVYVANTNPVFQQDPGSGHVVAIEAESFGDTLAQGGHTWSPEVSLAGYSGARALRAMPADGALYDTPGYAAVSPRLAFLVRFTATGVHTVWVRGWAPSGAGDDDSLHVGLDGVETAAADRMTSFGQTWTWSNTTLDAGAVATLDVPTPGLHRVNVWMREAGFAFDKIVLTTDPAYPSPLGNGPAESPRIGLGSTGGPVPIDDPAADVVGSCTCTSPGAQPALWALAWLAARGVARRRRR